jgi:hypothetical protein
MYTQNLYFEDEFVCLELEICERTHTQKKRCLTV